MVFPRAHDDLSRRMTSDVTVSGVHGDLPVVRQSQVMRQLSAALAEIFVNVAEHGTDAVSASRRRERRLLLAEALHDVLRHPGLAAGTPSRAAVDDGQGSGRHDLVKLLKLLSDQLTDPPDDVVSERSRRPLVEHKSLDVEQAVIRAVSVVAALRGADVIVVEIPRAPAQQVLTVHLPSRRLGRNHLSWMQLYPQARLELEVLLPSGSADRQLEIQLPPGMSCLERPARSPSPGPGGGPASEEPPVPRRAGAREPQLDVVVEIDPPRVMQQFRTVMSELSRALDDRHLHEGADGALAALAQVALSRLDAMGDLLRTHDAVDGPGAARIHRHLNRLRAGLAVMVAAGGEQAPPDRLRKAANRTRSAWDDGSWLPHALRRRAPTQAPNRRQLFARLDGVDDPDYRGATRLCYATLDVAVTEHLLGSVALFASSMGLMLITTAFVLFTLLPEVPGKGGFDAQVLAGALTLFAAVLAARVVHPDRSTLHGLLSSAGYFAIAASTLPTVLLAIALAFPWAQAHASIACLVCLLLQVCFVMFLFVARRRCSRAVHRHGPRMVLQSEPVGDHRLLWPLHRSWWRALSAEALALGRPAYGYVVEQVLTLPAAESPATGDAAGSGSERPAVADVTALIGLRKLLQAPPAATDHHPADQGDGGLANLLALLRAATERQSMTFLVFRDQPEASWRAQHHASPVVLNPDRLVPHEPPMTYLMLHLGLRADATDDDRVRPLLAMLRILARGKLTVDEVLLPSTPPACSAPDLRWATIRVPVGDSDLPSLAQALLTIARYRPRARDRDLWILATLSRCRKVFWIRGQAPTRRATTRGTLRGLRARDLDVVGPLARSLGAQDPTERERTLDRTWQSEPGPAPVCTWQITTLTADAGAGIEYDILKRYTTHRPDLCVVGMTSAVLHGVCVVFLLAYRRACTAGERGAGGQADAAQDAAQDDAQDDVRSGDRPADALARDLDGLGVAVHHDDPRTLTQLGRMDPLSSLITVETASADARGGLVATLNELIDEFTPRSGPTDGEDRRMRAKPRVWHMHMKMHEGRRSAVHIALRLSAAIHAQGETFDARCRTCESRIRQALKERIAQGAAGSESSSARAVLEGTHADITPCQCSVHGTNG
jgi:hypothetical protein